MNRTVYDLWDSCKKYGENTRVKEIDVYDSWKRLKKIIKDYDLVMGKWSIDLPIMYKQIKDMGFKDKSLFIRPAIIPKNNKKKPYLVKLMKIAYFIGRLNQIMNIEESTIYDQSMRDYYLSKNMDSAKTYMPECVLDLMTQEISEKMFERVDRLNERLLADQFSQELEGGNYWRKEPRYYKYR